jgi:hypothetical protein
MPPPKGNHRVYSERGERVESLQHSGQLYFTDCGYPYDRGLTKFRREQLGIAQREREFISPTRSRRHSYFLRARIQTMFPANY